jgi:hypothetical protein
VQYSQFDGIPYFSIALSSPFLGSVTSLITSGSPEMREMARQMPVPKQILQKAQVLENAETIPGKYRSLPSPRRYSTTYWVSRGAIHHISDLGFPASSDPKRASTPDTDCPQMRCWPGLNCVLAFNSEVARLVTISPRHGLRIAHLDRSPQG